MRKNNFDYIRYYAAISVMAAHFNGYYLYLTGKFNPALYWIRESIVMFHSVVVLFAVSGFLVSFSMERSASVMEFIRKRVLRIFPGLWLCTVINVLSIAIVAPGLLNKDLIPWGIAQIFGIAYTPGSLKDYATGSVNGTLWTVLVQIQLYLILAISWKFISKLKMKTWIVIMAVLYACNLACDFASRKDPGFVGKLIERSALPYLCWFGAGVFCWIYRDKVIDFLKKTWWIFAGLQIILYLAIKDMPGYDCGISTGLLVPYAVIGVAFLGAGHRIKLDISYEMFLYHWIVLNALIHLGTFEKLPLMVVLPTFYVVSIALAYAAHLIMGLVMRKR